MSKTGVAKATKMVLVSASLCALVAAAPAFAHHSGAMYDNTKSVDLKGTIKEFNWTNPHLTIVVDAAGPDGKVQSWDIEGGSPNTLVKSGWRKSSFKMGDKVTITIHPMRNGTPGGSFMKAVLADGSPLPQARPNGAEAPRGG